jgi:hypothetical protein
MHFALMGKKFSGKLWCKPQLGQYFAFFLLGKLGVLNHSLLEQSAIVLVLRGRALILANPSAMLARVAVPRNNDFGFDFFAHEKPSLKVNA